mgnify:CR=1 FL=1
MYKVIALLVALFVLMSSCAIAETIQKKQVYEVEDCCALTLKDVKAYDVFFNQSSGNAHTFIVASICLQNLKTEQMFVKKDLQAKVIYDGDFEFPVNEIWPNVEGSYYCLGPNSNECYLWIHRMDDTGKLIATSITYDSYSEGNRLDNTSTDFESVSITQSFSGFNGYEFIYSPLDDSFHGTDYLSEHNFVSIDESKTVLDPIVERTYHFVFIVPDLVAKEEGSRELSLVVDDEEFSFRF